MFSKIKVQLLKVIRNNKQVYSSAYVTTLATTIYLINAQNIWVLYGQATRAISTG